MKVIPEILNLKDLNIGKRYLFTDHDLGVESEHKLIKLELLCHSLCLQNDDGVVSGDFILLSDVGSVPKYPVELFENDFYTVSYRNGFEDYFSWCFFEIANNG